MKQGKTGIVLVFALFCVSTTGLRAAQFVTLNGTATSTPVMEVDDSIFSSKAPNTTFYGTGQSPMQSGYITALRMDSIDIAADLQSGQQLAYVTVTFAGSFKPTVSSGTVTLYQYAWNPATTYAGIQSQQNVPMSTAAFTLTTGALTLTIPGSTVLADPSNNYAFCFNNNAFGITGTTSVADLLNSPMPPVIEAYTSVTAVPEPATWLGGAMVVLGSSLVRRRLA